MKRIVAILVAAISFAAAAPPASAAYHSGCGDLNPNHFEFCAVSGYFTHFQLSGTGKFTIQLPYGGLATAHYVSYRNWQAYVTGPGNFGHPGVRNIGCCWETFWNGWVW